MSFDFWLNMELTLQNLIRLENWIMWMAVYTHNNLADTRLNNICGKK